jgi:hypothetical protein
MQPADEFVDVRLARSDRPDEHRRIAGPSLRVRDADEVLVAVQTDEKSSRL